jgi:hypothetical protein
MAGLARTAADGELLSLPAESAPSAVATAPAERSATSEGSGGKRKVDPNASAILLPSSTGDAMGGVALKLTDAPSVPGRHATRSAWFFTLLLLAFFTLTFGTFTLATGQAAGWRTAAAPAWRRAVSRIGHSGHALWKGGLGRGANRRESAAIAALRADLHDGPAQHLAYALMHLDALEPQDVSEGDHRREAYRKIGQSIRIALDEMREIASGTSLPDIRRLDPAAVIADAVLRHERRTQTTVERQIAGLPSALAPSVKVCLYRFTQEGLNNAYRHANGKGQKLTIKLAGNEILAEVADEGPGAAEAKSKSDRLGLAGLRERAEAAGGRLEIVSLPGRGTKLMLRLPASKRGVSG